MGIAERYEKVEEELAQECALAGRDPKEVRLVAVSKTVGVEGVGEAYAAGARDFGENRPDQIVPKSQADNMGGITNNFYISGLTQDDLVELIDDRISRQISRSRIQGGL